MEKNKEIKISLSTLLLIIAVIIILIMGYFIYSILNTKKELEPKNTIINNENEVITKSNIISKENNIVENEIFEEDLPKLNFGTYTVDEISYDGAGVSNKDCGIELKSNNIFSVNIGWGFSYEGNYEIINNTLVCKATSELVHNGNTGNLDKYTADVLFKFEIVNSNKLKLILLDINQLNMTTKSSFDDSFELGMTYSIK